MDPNPVATRVPTAPGTITPVPRRGGGAQRSCLSARVAQQEGRLGSCCVWLLGPATFTQDGYFPVPTLPGDGLPGPPFLCSVALHGLLADSAWF